MILDVKLWFNIHRILMILLQFVTITGFCVILFDSHWKWIKHSKENFVNFLHSIFGIVLIGFAVVQVFEYYFRKKIQYFQR